MILTNKHNLPETFVRAFHKNQGERKNTGFASATELLKSPRQFILSKRHRDEIEEDVSDMIWSIFGTGIHAVLEQGKGEDDITELRLSAEVMNETVSGQADLYTNKTIYDYKTTSVWSVVYKDRAKDWEEQLNIYGYLFRQNGYEVESLKIVALLRDWSKTKARTDREYPQSQVVEMEVPLWDIERQRGFVLEKMVDIKAHEETEDDKLPLCTDKDRWRSPSKWAVHKKGRKSAVKLFDNEEEALNQVDILGAGHYVDYHPGEDRKCDEYCNVNKYCEYWLNKQK